MTEIKTSQILLPEGDTRGQLFYVLHEENEQLTNMPFLLGTIRAEFPDAVIRIAVVALDEDTAWLDAGDTEPSESATVQLAPRLAANIKSLEHDIQTGQNMHGVLSEATAVIGVGPAGSLVLGLTLLEQPIAGRLITFGAKFPAYPLELSLDTTVHLLHADRDTAVSSARAREAHERMAQLQADATIDIAMNSAESFSEVLIGKMFERLKTCVPLRYWRYAAESESDKEEGRTPPTSLH
jgi:phospholipase/carboxylesterase